MNKTTIKKEDIKLIEYTNRSCVSSAIECWCIIQFKNRLLKNISTGFKETEKWELEYWCQNWSRTIGYLESAVSEIKDLPKGFNVGYSNTYKTKTETKIAVIPCGYMDGINIINNRDMFRTIDKIRYIVRDIKDFFKKQKIYIKIKDKNYEIIGRIGTYHIICNISNSDIKIGNKVIINVNPKFVDSSIRREYR